MVAQELNNLIQKRRSILPNAYNGEKVDDAIITQILENAHWAPTHKLTQPWRFIVYTGDGLKTLANLQAEFYKKTTQADGTFKEERYKNLLVKPMESSHIIVMGMKRDAKKSLPEIEEVGAVFCALQNIYLSVTAYGLAGYLSTGGITYFKDAQKEFGWGEDDKLIGFFHIGIPKGTAPDGKRAPLEECLTWVKG